MSLMKILIIFLKKSLVSCSAICELGQTVFKLNINFERENLSWSSTCESVGGTTGWLIGQVLFLVLESADFSNKYLRNWLGFEEQIYGVVTIESTF
jgi:hypothetical protein